VEVVQEIVAHAAHAATLTSLIEKVGSYAGFAAIVGLAVLSALYFSQARDVKRLRDWAGRAPERSAEVQAGGRTPEAAAARTGQPPARTVGPAQPVARPPAAGQPGAGTVPKPGVAPKPAVAPAGAVAAGAAAAGNAGAVPATAAAGASSPATPAPATAGAGASTAAGAASSAGAAPATASAGTSTAPKPARATPGAGVPRQGAPAAAGGGPPGGGTAAPPRTVTHPGTGAKVLPARPVQPRPRPIPTPGAGGSTAVIPPPSHGRRWTAPRYLALIVAGVIVLGLGGTMAVLALTGKDDKGSGKAEAPTLELPKGGGDQKSSKKPSRPAPPPIDPSTVTVAVLNGTTVTGLAGTTGQKVVASGFRLGNVATASQQARAESVVLYRPGSSRQARAVARKLGISQIEPVDAQSAALAGAATVIVVVGADKAHA
jgi:LytR cell envelope-related transcriptional attenuator